jgi:hypothetical protein
LRLAINVLRACGYCSGAAALRLTINILGAACKSSADDGEKSESDLHGRICIKRRGGSAFDAVDAGARGRGHE